MTIADNQELSLLLAVIERALRDAKGAPMSKILDIVNKIA